MSPRALMQVALTCGLSAWAIARLDRVSLGVRELRLGWLVLGILCTVPPFVAAAWRWCFTARRLGLELRFRHALPEVYAAALLNGLLPTGLAGDALRVVRHGSALAQGAPTGGLASARALQAVVLERASGQLALWSLLLAGLPLWPTHGARMAVLGGGVLALALIVALVWSRGLPPEARLARALRSAHVTLIADGAWRTQLVTSFVVVLGCGASFACGAYALGVATPLDTLARVVPPLLAVSALPLSIGGFGVREVTNAALFSAAGLDADLGVAVAAAYGLMALIGSLPGALCLWLRRSGEGGGHAGG